MSATILTCPATQSLTMKPSIFLAGGITSCPNWQADAVDKLRDLNITIFNPRRATFNVNDPSMSKKQISWEFHALRIATIILFWFPKESICPIALYELGFWNNSKKSLVVGTHPGYQRLFDIIEQTTLVRPLSVIYRTLDDVVAECRRKVASINRISHRS